MGKKDIVTKDYTEDCRIFADAFNQYIYKGRAVIDPEKLHPLDTVQAGVLYGSDGIGAPVQKFRDSLKYMTAMEDEEAVYLLMGLENQSEVNYAMPVKDMVYDALQYASQVEKIAKAHRDERKNIKQTGEHSVYHKKVNAGEYLSGFYKEDRLVPVITLVLYFNAGEWDGPVSLHDMMSVKNPEILALVSDYRINLIAPANMSDDELNQFTTSLREVMMFIKYSKDKDRLQEILQTDERFRNVEKKAATVISTVTGIEFEIEEEEEEVDMCQALKEIIEDANKEGMQQGILDERTTIAKRMLQEGSLSVEFIARMLDVSVDKLKAFSTE